MKLDYDPEGDILTLYLKEGKIADSNEDRPGIIFDYDDQDDIVSVEILSASRRVSDLGQLTVNFPVSNHPIATA